MTAKPKPSRLADMIQAVPRPTTPPLDASLRNDVSTYPRAHERMLVKLTLNMPSDVVDALKSWALANRVSVGAILEALAVAAHDDETLRASVNPTARRITDERRARK